MKALKAAWCGKFLYGLIMLYKAVLSLRLSIKTAHRALFRTLTYTDSKEFWAWQNLFCSYRGRSTPVKGKSRILSTFAEWDWLPKAAKQIENLLNSFLSKGWWKRRRLGWPVCDLVVIKVTEIQKGFPLIALELFHYIKIFVGSVFRLKSVEKG